MPQVVSLGEFMGILRFLDMNNWKIFYILAKRDPEESFMSSPVTKPKRTSVPTSGTRLMQGVLVPDTHHLVRTSA
jgi:hypothetical protein